MAGYEDQPPEEEQDHIARLPNDVLADVFRRVPPRSLAASRCVRRAWRDTIDARRLLRADLLPVSLAGVFIHLDQHKFPEFFHRPSSSTGARPVSGKLDFLPSANLNDGYIWNRPDDWKDYIILDHCNGLLLLKSNCVVNPATRRWHTLPPCPPKRVSGNVSYMKYLAFDPAESPHYQVFMIPCLKGNYSERDPFVDEKSEWPPSLCKMHVFSSRSGCWEETSFVREGDAAGTVGEMQVNYDDRFTTAAYFRGALYVHCKYDFIMRISLTSNTYHVIKPPMVIRGRAKDYPYLDVVARSEKGVYFASLHNGWLLVWILDESCGQVKWKLKHKKCLEPCLNSILASHNPMHGPWILEDINYNLFLSSRFPKDKKKAIVEKEFEWNSDNDDVHYRDVVEDCYLEDKKKSMVEENVELNSNSDNALDNWFWVEEHYEGTEILGFHPYKEIVFLSITAEIGLAYHLNSSNMEVLGKIYPRDYTDFKWSQDSEKIISSFAYTPCWMEEFPRKS